MALYRDQVERVTLPMVRAQMKPTRFREAQSIRLEKYNFEVQVLLARVPNPTCYGGARVFFVCPRIGCGALVNVLAVAMWVGWGCTKCLRWRGRNRRRMDVASLPPWPTERDGASEGAKFTP